MRDTSIGSVVRAGREAKQVRKLNWTHSLLMDSFGNEGEAHGPAPPDVLAATPPPATTRGDGRCAPLSAHPGRPRVRLRPPCRRHRAHARRESPNRLQLA